MSIEKTYDEFELFCDICQTRVDETFERYTDVFRYIYENEWTAKKIKDEWINMCPECSEP